MPDYFRAVAVDFDGTLTSGGRPTEDVLDAIARTRAAGRRMILVTGRILTELRAVFPDVDQWFDAIVAEIAMLPDPAHQDPQDEPDPVLEAMAAFTGLPHSDLVTGLAAFQGATAVLVDRDTPHVVVPLTPGNRRTSSRSGSPRLCGRL